MTFISNKNKLIFIDIPKNASTSILNNLILLNGISSDCDPLHKPKEEQSRKDFINRVSAYRHKKAYEVLISDKLDYQWDQYTSFCVLRNPWHRCVSYINWYYRKIYNIYIEYIPKCAELLSLYKKLFEPYDFDKQKILCDFVKNNKIPYQSDFIVDNIQNKNTIIVSDILKLENLQSDYTKLCNKYNLLSSIKKMNTAPKYKYKEYYNKNLIDMVYEKEKLTVSIMNYKV